MSTDSPDPGAASRRLNVLAAALVLLACWSAWVLAYLPDQLRSGYRLAAAGTILHVLACSGGLVLAAAALRAGERLLAFTLLAASFPFLLMATKWALIAGGFLAAVLAVEAFLSDVTGTGLDPYDARLLAGAGASTLMWLLLLAGSRVSRQSMDAILPGAIMVWVALVPGFIALYQVIRATLVMPETRDMRSRVPLAMIAVSLVRLFVS